LGEKGHPRRLKWFEIMINIDLDNLKEYANTLEDLLEQKERSFSIQIEQEAHTFTEDQREEFYEFHADTHWQIAEVFPDILRKSLFTTCYSYLEDSLNRYGDYLYKHNTYKLTLSDLKHDGIVRAQVYLKKVVGINFPDQTPTWMDIKQYNLIRNFIIHNNGKIKGDPNKLEPIMKFIDDHPSITLKDRERIVLSKEFSLEFIKTMGVFFSLLTEELP